MNEEVPYESVQWQGILSKIREAGPSLVHVEILDASLTYTFLQQYFANPVKGALVNAGYAASVPAFGDVIKQGNVEGVLGMTLSAQLPGPEGDAFVKNWQARYNELPPWSLAAQLYDEVNMWAAAVKQVGRCQGPRQGRAGDPGHELQGPHRHAQVRRDPQDPDERRDPARLPASRCRAAS